MTMNLNRLAEWDRGLPRPDELTPISQALIPQELACAFNIPHLYPPSTCTDVVPLSSSEQHASAQAAFESLLRMRSVLLPSTGSGKPGEAEAARPLQKTDGDEIKPSIKGTTEQNPGVSQSEAVDVLMASRPLSSSSPGCDYTSMHGPHNSNGLSRLMSSSYSHVPESSGAEVSLTKASLEEGRGGCGRMGGLISEATNLMHLKLDSCEEVDSGPSIDALQGTAVALSSEDQFARTLKKPRLVWTPQLHKRFVDAVAQLGIKHAVPKTIMQLMNVDGLTRENVASHLQKYRLYLKRMQGLSNEGPSSSDHLFASTPVPPSLAASAHFLVSQHSHHQLHREPAFVPVHNTALPSLLGHNAHHVPSHMSSPMVTFSSFDARASFPALPGVPPPSSLGSEHVKDIPEQHSTCPPGRILTLFPTSGS